MPTLDDVRAAARRISGRVHRTPVITSGALDRWLGCTAFVKAEHLQRTGSFKLRGATNAVEALGVTEAQAGVAAHSSGNHAAALARAAATRGIPCHVVMPVDVSAVKRDAVERAGATVTSCENSVEAREATLREVVERTGAIEIHPFDNDMVIAGAGTAALELVEEIEGLDVLVVPIGGGGLASGSCIAAHGVDPLITVAGAEPLLADDAARSLSSDVRQPALPPTTIADGLRTGLSQRTFAILRDHLDHITTVEEHEIIEAMRVVAERTKQMIEPSAAVPFAALRRDPIPDLRIGIICSGGNVELPALARLFAP